MTDIDEASEERTFHVSAGNMSAHYDLGHVTAASEEDTIRIVSTKAFRGCALGLQFRA